MDNKRENKSISEESLLLQTVFPDGWTKNRYENAGGIKMDVTFMEKIVKKQKENIDYIKIAGIILAVFAIVFIALSVEFLTAFLPILLVGSVWGAWWLITSMSQEFEYSVTDNFIDIDCIIARRKRTRVFSGDVKECEICARVNTDYYKEYSKRTIKVLNFAPSTDLKNNYFIVTKNNAKKAKTKGETVLVIFEPDDRMIPSLRKFGPSKIKVD